MSDLQELADNNTTVESEPVDTSAKMEEINDDGVEELEDDSSNKSAEEDTHKGKEPDDEAEAQEEAEDEPKSQSSSLDLAALKKLNEATSYKSGNTELGFFDEYGALDETKFKEFLELNNKAVFEQSLNAFRAENELRQAEEESWKSIYKDYPEIKENPNLLKALQGARIQDVISGGKGDLNELAKSIVDPLRENKVQAIESMNKTVRKQESLSAFKPNVAQTEKVPLSLMSQLKEANMSGDTELASKLRHEILKERIFGEEKE